jgi:hypothetical protein
MYPRYETITGSRAAGRCAVGGPAARPARARRDCQRMSGSLPARYPLANQSLMLARAWERDACICASSDARSVLRWIVTVEPGSEALT